ncbi:MAG: DUF4271 domain-containing protein [Tannerellaceae bacterium]|jgi:hypothetical protein|nr:DUF4271 domain-containing protein [Tannerellaceae bacterium]
MNGFEGYIGIRAGEDQLIDDLIFALLTFLFMIFAITFHANHNLFKRMLRDIIYTKERLSLFESAGGNENLFRAFMIFQSLFLTTTIMYMLFRSHGYIHAYEAIEPNLLALGIIFAGLLAFYFVKQMMYHICGYVFAGPYLYKTWRTCYTASTGFVGALLYAPALCLAFTDINVNIPLYGGMLIYLLWRLTIMVKTVHLFNIKAVGFVYIILYLCAQEILPLIFLHEGVIYLYNLY